MRASEGLRMGVRSLRERPLETGLIVLGIALASCIAAASFILLQSQAAQTERILQGPAFREIVVQAVNQGESAQRDAAAATPIDTTQSQTDRISLSDADLQKVLAQLPAVKYGYRYDTGRVRTSGNGGGGFFGGGPNGGGPGPAVATAAGTAGTGRTGTASSATGASGAASAGAGQGGDVGAAFRQQYQQETVPAGTVLLKPALDVFREVETSPAFFQAYGVGIAYGSFFTADDAKSGKAVTVLGQALARKLFPDTPVAELVGRKAQIQNRIWTVVGVLDDKAESTAISSGTALSELAFVPATMLAINVGGRTVQIGRAADSMRFAVADSSDLEGAQKSLQSYFDAAYGAGKVKLSVPFESARLSRDGFQRLLWIIVAFGAGTLAMALINLMNMMLTRALRRQGQIGILAAMGSSRFDVARLQLFEGGIMAAAGTLIGFLLAIPLHGVLFSAGMSLFGIEETGTVIDPASLLVLGPALVLLALLLALIPAVQISRVAISDALKSE